jgi:hypothetical protein
MAEEKMAHEAYTLIRNLFLNNQMKHTVYLETQFCSIVQDDLTIIAYCHCLKAILCAP